MRPHPIMGALARPWILPRAKNSPPDCFYTSVRTGAALSNPIFSSANKKATLLGGFFIGGGEGIRLHFLFHRK